MAIKNVLLDISHDIYSQSESIAASVTCFLVVNTFNWQYEVLRFVLGIAASILSGYVVNRLKKYWDKPNKRNGNNKRN